MGQQANDQPMMGNVETDAVPAGDLARPSSADFDVLVVGSGPTGLLAACELLRRGVRVRIIDRALETLKAPKALSLWPRVLDILDDLGVGDTIRRASVRINAFSYFSDRRPLASFSFPDDLAARQLPQSETERVLTERLHTLGGKVERGVRLLDLDLDEVDFSSRIEATNGVTAVLEHEGGAVERVHSPFVIGADGADSAVRSQLGIGFQGTTYEMAFALIDTRIEGYLPSDEILYYQAPAGTLVIVPQPDGVFRFLSVMPEGGQEISVPLTEAGRITARWLRVRVVRLPRGGVSANTLCRRPGYYLIRPDGHIAAHGHECDLNRLEAELSTVLNPLNAHGAQGRVGTCMRRTRMQHPTMEELVN